MPLACARGSCLSAARAPRAAVGRGSPWALAAHTWPWMWPLGPNHSGATSARPAPGWFTPPGLATGLAPSGEARSGTTGLRKPWGGLSGLRGYSGNRGWWAEESQEV